MSYSIARCLALTLLGLGALAWPCGVQANDGNWVVIRGNDRTITWRSSVAVEISADELPCTDAISDLLLLRCPPPSEFGPRDEWQRYLEHIQALPCLGSIGRKALAEAEQVLRRHDSGEVAAYRRLWEEVLLTGDEWWAEEGQRIDWELVESRGYVPSATDPRMP